MSSVPSAVLLPNLLILGAQKSGTSSIHQLLGRHPDIEMSQPKELRVLAWPDWRDRLDRYRGQFSEAASIRGEGTPAYLHDPDGPRKLRDLGGDRLRAICVLRHPTDRAYSHYWHSARGGQEPKSFEGALEAESVRIRRSFDDWRKYSYATRGFYEAYLDPYRAELGDRLLVLSFAAFVSDPSGVMEQIHAFLGLDPTRSPDFRPLRANPARLPRSRRLAHVVDRVDPTSSRSLVRVVRRFNVRKTRYEPMAPATRAQLDEHFASTVSAVLGRYGVDLEADRPRSAVPAASFELADRSCLWWPH